jgi:GTP-binding protein
MGRPSVVILGRPNVGKSTLFNRLTGTRRSIVTDEPGITRDRIYGTGNWRGRSFQVVDTGGILPDDKDAIPQEILRQARVAIEKATLLVLVGDAKAGLIPLDEELARLLRRTGKPLLVAVNKVDNARQEAQAAAFYALGAPVFPISAEHGLGVDVLLDGVLEHVRSEDAPEAAAEAAVEVAIIGRPNVGKSTLLNRLAGEERAIVAAEPGTTRDAVDTEVRRNDKLYRFVDTAGIRRKGKTKLVAEKLSVIMARNSLERADVALVVVDAERGVTQGDATIASYAEQSGRSVIIVMNKWDLALAAAREAWTNRGEVSTRTASPGRGARDGQRAGRVAEGGKPSSPFDPGELLPEYEGMVRGKLKFLSYAPVVFLSAKTGERVGKLFPLIERVAEARRRRITTGELNRWAREVDLDRGTLPRGRRARIYYITQASSSPPTFVLFTNQKQRLHFSFERFLENRLRARFDFTGAPIRFIQRLRASRRRAGETVSR